MPGNGLWPPPHAVYLANVGSTALTAGAAAAAFTMHPTAAGILATAATAMHAVNLVAGPRYFTGGAGAGGAGAGGAGAGGAGAGGAGKS